jgi:hypothetical protein
MYPRCDTPSPAANNAPNRRGSRKVVSPYELPRMTQRQRKFLGTIALFLLIAVYALIAMAVAIVLQVHNANKFVEFLYYIVAGLLWVVPAGALISWMQKPDT